MIRELHTPTRQIVVIPTRYKSRLPKNLSYPLGAEVISEALAGVPQFERLELWFSDRPVFSSMAFQAILREGTPYTIFEASFEKPTPDFSASRAMLDAGWYDPRWKVQVYPVLRERRQSARKVLLRDALPAIRRWLSQPEAANWNSGYHRLRFVFYPVDAVVVGHSTGEVLS